MLLGEGSLRGQQGVDSPGHSRGSSHGPPSPSALPRPNYLVADVASLTPTHIKAAQPLSGTSLPLLGYLAQLELLSHPPTASAAASYQLWVQSRLEPSERFPLVPVEECLEQAELVLQLLMWSSR